jgi:glutathionylspermidine synthase
MLRHTTQPRDNWQSIVESQGLFYHTVDGVTYWDESVFYEFTAAQVDTIEQVTYELQEMCLATVEHVLSHSDDCLPNFGVPEEFWEFIQKSWEEDEHTIYGRFDLAYNGSEPPKLLEYNADTPTSLLEASVAQYYWLQDTSPNRDQFNNIHERLLEAFQRIKNDREISVPFYFTGLDQDDSIEDYMTLTYLRDVAVQAELDARQIAIQNIGYTDGGVYFLDGGEEIHHIFKLYPWEWLFQEEFGANLLSTETEWYEPAWKSILSNKAFLPYIYDLFGDSPYILKASFDQSNLGNTFVRKPIYSREGQNILIVRDGDVVGETGGEYGEFPVIYQQYEPLPVFAGNTPVIGSWMVNGYACGMGIRETEGMITNNTSRFVPHRFIPTAAGGRFGGTLKRLLGK